MAESPTHPRQGPPQAPPSFKGITPFSINGEIDTALSTSSDLLDKLSTVTPSAATFANLVRPLLDITNHTRRRTVIPTLLLSRVSTDPEIRQAARDAQTRVDGAEARNLRRADIARLVAAVYEREKNSETLDDEDRHVLYHLHRKYMRTGATLEDGSTRARLEAAQSEISETKAAAMKCFTEADEGIWFTRRELDGCAESWIVRLKRGDEGGEDRFWVTFRDDDYVRVLRSATREETRRKLFLGAQTRFPENVDRLSRLVILRDEVARILGYQHHAALRMEDTMVRSVDKLREMLVDLQMRLEPLARSEMDTLAALKPQVTDDLRQDMTVWAWDRLFLTNLHTKQHFSVDNAKVSEYFEVNNTVAEMLRVFEDLFGMEFVCEPEMDTWHSTVSPFSVWNSTSEGGEFLGYLYLDIFGRPGKFASQYHSRIRWGFFDADGVRHYPVSALVCSYPESTPEKPSLLTHRDVRILFHELGHAIHHLVDQSKYASGQSRDFYEIPSKMLEHFVWVPEVMVRLSRHYTTLPTYRPEGDRHDISQGNAPDGVQDAEKETKIPLDLANAVARTKMLNQATALMGFIQPALFDLAIYSPESHEDAAVDTTALWNDMKHRDLPYKYPEDEVMFGQASFSSFFRVYDVGYFTYAMSEIYAADIYQSAFAENPLSAEAGRKWRYEVLARGSSQPELEMLEQFLGRPPNLDAIFELISNPR